LACGAQVMVDDGADTAGGVFVSWSASPRLRPGTSRALLLGRLDDPLLRHSAEIKAAMMQAMAAILTAAGFAIQDTNDDDRPYEFRVAGGPAPGVPPIWSLRHEEVAMPAQVDPVRNPVHTVEHRSRPT
jgi:hypothetical protein